MSTLDRKRPVFRSVRTIENRKTKDFFCSKFLIWNEKERVWHPVINALFKKWRLIWVLNVRLYDLLCQTDCLCPVYNPHFSEKVMKNVKKHPIKVINLLYLFNFLVNLCTYNLLDRCRHIKLTYTLWNGFLFMFNVGV